MSKPTSTLQRFFFDDRWFRHESYEIRDGYLRPAPGARLIEYRPWKNYADPAGRGARSQPYHSLLSLVSELGHRPSDRFRSMRGLTPEQKKAIVGWCNSYGLLGVLLHQTEMITLPATPQWLDLPGIDVQVPRFTRYTRTARAWAKEDPLAQGVDPVPGAIMREMGGFKTHVVSLSNWGRFFPEVHMDQRETFAYPMPFSPSFWNQYAEPVTAFLSAAYLLSDAVEGLRGSRHRGSAESFLASENKMHALTSPARALLYAAPGGSFRLGWACHSLLTAFAMMATLDLTESRIGLCANKSCERFFSTKAKEGKYCSPRCRGVVQIRRYRRRLEKKGRAK